MVPYKCMINDSCFIEMNFLLLIMLHPCSNISWSIFWATTRVNQCRAHLTFMQECCKSCDKTLKLMFLPFFLLYTIDLYYNQTTRSKERYCLCNAPTKHYIAQFARLHIPHVTRKLTLFFFFCCCCSCMKYTF